MIDESAARWLVYEMTADVDALQQELFLTNAELLELEKLATLKRKSEYLGVRIAFKKLLGKEIRINYDESGKPYLADHSLQLSISHSKNWIAVMAHPTNRVGIDIECPRQKIMNIYTRFLSIDEQRDLYEGTDIRKLLIAWSAKEALYKIIGDKASDFANQLRIYSFDLSSSGLLQAVHVPTAKIYQLNYQQNSDYTLVYCVENNEQG